MDRLIVEMYPEADSVTLTGNDIMVASFRRLLRNDKAIRLIVIDFEEIR